MRVAPILLLKTKGARIPSMGIIPNFSLVECVAPFPPKMHISMGEGHPPEESIKLSWNYT